MKFLNKIQNILNFNPSGKLEEIEKYLKAALSITDEITELIQTIAKISPWLALFFIWLIKKKSK